ncbi:MAG: glycerol-3-phosphate 1-O-acyltransferase PlsY [Flavobacteriaceae bacterium]
MTGAVLLSAVFGYLLGSIPFGLLITRAAGLGDIRAIGSGNIGTTNVLRTGRKELAALTLLMDMAKATAAVLIAGRWGDLAGLVAGAGAFFGHLFPVWLRFKGGKGVATYLGALIGAAPLAALAFAVVWLAVAAISRYSSLAALAASLLAPLAVYLSGAGMTATAIFAGLTVVLWIAHRQNIARLAEGSESRIGAK